MIKYHKNLQNGVHPKNNELVTSQELEFFNNLCKKYNFNAEITTRKDRVYYSDERQQMYNLILEKRDTNITQGHQQIEDNYQQEVSSRALNLAASSFFSYLPLLIANTIVDNIDALMVHMRKDMVTSNAESDFKKAKQAIIAISCIVDTVR